MARYWILMFSWFGVASLQYIKTAGPGAESLLDPLDATIHYPPLPYVNYVNNPPRNDYETQNGEQQSTFYVQDNEQPEPQRKRRTVMEEKFKDAQKKWSNFIENDIKTHHHIDESASPYILGIAGANVNNTTEVLSALEKRNFSPWGGKRSDIEHMWTWKRSSNIREPSMPKRVRFSPWGGKRSGQMIYKPETKSSRMIFSATVPDLTRIISNYPPGNRLNVAGILFTPAEHKRHTIKVLPLNSQMDEPNFKDMPFKTFFESLPKYFRPGQTFANVYLKKDGKRKLKFSAWGGKRSPPIIGPIWAPTTQDMKEAALNTIVLIRNSQDDARKTT